MKSFSAISALIGARIQSKAILLAVSSLVLLHPVVGQTILWENPITGNNPNTDNPYIIGDLTAANLSVSGIGRGAGIVGSNANNRYNANDWNTAALDPTGYFSFTIHDLFL